MKKFLIFGCLVALFAGLSDSQSASQKVASSAASPAMPSADQHAFVKQYCVACHSDKLKTGNLSLQSEVPLLHVIPMWSALNRRYSQFATN